MALALFLSVDLTNNGINSEMIAMPPIKLLANYASERVRRYIWVVPYPCIIAHMAYNNLNFDGTQEPCACNYNLLTLEKSQKCMGINCVCTIKVEDHKT